MNDNRVGLLTYQNQLNYGGILQACALYRVLSDRDPRVEVINFHCHPNNRDLMGDPPRLGPGRTGRRILRQFILKSLPPWFSRRIAARRRTTQAFLRSKLRMGTKVYASPEDFCELREYPCIVVGSDQVWAAHGRNRDTCLLTSVPSGIRRIAYAVSLGDHSIPPSLHALYRAATLDFAAISVREKRAFDELTPLVPKDIPFEIALDPTLLISERQWRELLGGPVGDHGECTIYWIGDVENLKSVIRNRRAVHGPVRLYFSWHHFATIAPLRAVLDLKSFLLRERVRCCFDAGPSEFLQGMAGAGEIVADSYHAMMFGLLFRKPLRIFAGPQAGVPNRMEDFALRYGLSNVLFRNALEVREPTPLPDYDRFQERISEDRRRSLQFLDHVG